jgi:hypothetical protein
MFRVHEPTSLKRGRWHAIQARNIDPDLERALADIELRLLAETCADYPASHIINRLVRLGLGSIPKDAPLAEVFGTTKRLRNAASRFQRMRDEVAEKIRRHRKRGNARRSSIRAITVLARAGPEAEMSL